MQSSELEKLDAELGEFPPHFIFSFNLQRRVNKTRKHSTGKEARRTLLTCVFSSFSPLSRFSVRQHD